MDSAPPATDTESDRSFGEADVPKIYNEIFDVRSKSERFGRALGLPKGTVDSILGECQKPENRLLRIIDEFVRQLEPIPTWRIIVDALRTPLVNEPQLAQQIENKHCSGPQTREAPPVSPSPQTSAKVAATNERSNPITASAESNPVQCQLQPAYGPPTAPQSMLECSYPRSPTVPHETAEHPHPALQPYQPGTRSHGHQLTGPAVAPHYVPTPLEYPSPRSPVVPYEAAEYHHPPLSRYQHVNHGGNPMHYQLSDLAVAPQSMRTQLESPRSTIVPYTTSNPAHPNYQHVNGDQIHYQLSVSQRGCGAVMASGDEVMNRIKELDSKFTVFRNSTRQSLERHSVEVSAVADALTALSPFHDDDHHKMFLKDHVQALYGASSHFELFGTMNFHWNYLDPSLLDLLVSKFDLQEVRVVSEAYDCDLHQFRVTTPLSTFCRTQKRKRIKPPADFKEMVAEFEWPPTVTLEVVEQFRQECASHYNLKECAMMLAKIVTGSFIITWLIPGSVADRMKEGVPMEIIHKFSVTSVKVDGAFIYCSSKESSAKSALTGLDLGMLASERTQELLLEKSYYFIKDEYLCTDTTTASQHDRTVDIHSVEDSRLSPSDVGPPDATPEDSAMDRAESQHSEKSEAGAVEDPTSTYADTKLEACDQEPTEMSPDSVKSKLSFSQISAEQSSTECTQKPTSPEHSPVSVGYVRAKVRKYKKRFKELKKSVQESLDRHNISVETVSNTLKSLSADDTLNHKLFSESQTSAFEEAHNQSVLIGQLQFSMDYLSYHLLDYLVEEFDLEDVKVDMEAYKSDLKEFRMKTPLSQFCSAQKGRTKSLVGFQELVAEFNQLHGTRGMKLEVIQKFWLEYVAHYNFKACSMVFDGIKLSRSNFKCTWLVPHSLVATLKARLPRTVFEACHVTRLSIAGACVYRYRGKSGSDSSGPESSSLSLQTSEEDFAFVEDPDEDFLCPVTMGLLLQPHLTTCCGKHLSQEAAKQIKKEGKACPLCKSTEWSTVMNHHFRRRVSEVKVFCHDPECDWQGPLSELERHMQHTHHSSSVSSAENSVEVPAVTVDPLPVTADATPSSYYAAPVIPSKIKSVEAVRDEIRMLRERFNSLKKSCIIGLEKNRVTLGYVIDTLKSLPADGTKVHPMFSESHLSVFYEVFDYSELFGTLGFNMNYLSFQILEYFANEFGLEQVMKEVDNYKSDLRQFRERTPVQLFCLAEPKTDIEPPPNFRKLISVFNSSENMMLEDVERFRKEYSNHYSLYGFAMTCAKADTGSVVVTWFIPESVCELLVETEHVPRDILWKYSVMKLDVDGGCVYRFHTTQTKAPVVAQASSYPAASAAPVSDSSRHSDKDYQFVEQPTEDYFCPVKKTLLLQPHLTSCCGQHLSQEVASRRQNEGKKCPLCNAINWSTIWDKRFQREVKALPVFCRNKSRGCDWEGEIFSLDVHLQSCANAAPQPHRLPPQEMPVVAPVDTASPSRPHPSELMEAVRAGNKHKVASLLSMGADPNVFPPGMSFTPLMEASQMGNVEIARLLLDNGADPNLANHANWTTLLTAADNCQFDIVKLLLERGAKPNEMSKTGWSPLMAAVFKSHDDIALWIVKAGAAPHIQDKNRTSAILLAVERHKHDTVVHALLDHVDQPSHLDIQDSGGKTALTFACMKKKLAVVKRLLYMGANPNIYNNERETPLLIATRLGATDIVRTLLEHKANPNMGIESPLTVAENLRYGEIADMLNQYGANTN